MYLLKLSFIWHLFAWSSHLNLPRLALLNFSSTHCAAYVYMFKFPTHEKPPTHIWGVWEASANMFLSWARWEGWRKVVLAPSVQDFRSPLSCLENLQHLSFFSLVALKGPHWWLPYAASIDLKQEKKDVLPKYSMVRICLLWKPCLSWAFFPPPLTVKYTSFHTSNKMAFAP